MKILLVDDETELTEPLRKILDHEGYQVDIADNGALGMELALANSYDLFILDWMLPKMSGLEICQQLRAKAIATPVLLLTAKDTIDDRVLGLDAGADDYLVKPFELRELKARVRALLRRGILLDNQENVESQDNNNRGGKLKVATLELDRQNCTVYRRGKAIALSEKELELLTYFMSNPGKLLTQENIYHHLWKERDKPSSNVVAALVRLLRRKVEFKNEPNLIQTVYGKGYRFGERTED